MSRTATYEMKTHIEEFGKTLALSWQLFSRTIAAKYRRSFLGYLWLLCPALMITGTVSLANRSGIINVGDTQLPYPLFALIGILLWQTFVEAFEVPHQAFDGASAYLTKVCFAREAIVLTQLFESLINTFVRFLLVLLLVAVSGVLIWSCVPVLALCFAGTVMLGLGIGTVLMPFTLLFADLHKGIKLLLSYGLLLTPALYVPSGTGLFSTIVRWNPISPLIRSAREAATAESVSEPVALLLVLGSSVTLTLLGAAMIRVSAPIIVERMLLGGR